MRGAKDVSVALDILQRYSTAADKPDEARLREGVEKFATNGSYSHRITTDKKRPGRIPGLS